MMSFKRLLGFSLYLVPIFFGMHLNAQESLKNFRTDGSCSVLDKKSLMDTFQQEVSPKIPFSYAKEDGEIFRNRGVSPKTTKTVKALQKVSCLYRAKDRMLVVGAEDNSLDCGWVDVENLVDAREDNVILGVDLAPCGRPEAETLRDFCAKVDKLETSSRERELLRGCLIPNVKNSLIKTKFVTDNTTKVKLSQDGGVVKRELPVYASPLFAEPFGTINVFTISEVYDIARGFGGKIRILLGSAGSLKGWIDLDSGHIWYSKLSTYFSQNGIKDVFQNSISSRESTSNEALAKKPSISTFRTKKEFPKFPVLFDKREKSDTDPVSKLPHLQIAFIGKFCSQNKNKMCATGESGSQAFDVLLKPDILFLVDGTKSMKKYFEYVSNAVSNFTQKYVGDPDYQFGLAIYGDFKRRGKVGENDPLDFKVVHELQPNYGDLFENLSDPNLLFVEDVQGDKVEPTNTAIITAANNINWSPNKLHFMIHIADHGDRRRPGASVIKALRSKNIVYIPIAVEGEGQRKESEFFVSDSNIIHSNYTTENGASLAIRPIITYGETASSQRSEEEAISRALITALELGLKVQDSSFSNNLNNGDDLVDGTAVLTKALIDLYGLDVDKNNELYAATGYIETVGVGEPENNWDYFVSLERPELDSLKRNMESVCESLGSSSDSKIVETSVCEMVETLSGDTIPNKNCAKILFSGSIPIQTETIIGSGIRNLLNDVYNGKNIESYKREFCKTYELTSLMQQGVRLPEPYDGGSLLWRDDYFDVTNEEQFDWRYKDQFNIDRFYLPLSYLPQGE